MASESEQWRLPFSEFEFIQCFKRLKIGFSASTESKGVIFRSPASVASSFSRYRIPRQMLRVSVLRCDAKKKHTKLHRRSEVRATAEKQGAERLPKRASEQGAAPLPDKNGALFLAGVNLQAKTIKSPPEIRKRAPNFLAGHSFSLQKNVIFGTF